MTMKKCLLVIASSASILCAALLGSEAQKQASDSRAVHVDVIVTQKNEPVKDLTTSDFRLFEDGKEVPLESLELIEKKTGTAGTGDAKKLVVIFHDMSFWEKNIKPRVDELAEELVKLSRQGIAIMVLELNWQTDLAVLQPFTTNEELVRKAAETATRSVGEGQIHEDLRTERIQNPISAAETQGMAQAEGGIFQAFLNIERQRFEKALGGLLAACNMVKSSSGRKSILLISSGIPDLSSTSQTDILSGEKTESETLDAIHSRDQERIGKVRIFDPFDIMKKKEYSRTEDVIQEVTRFANTYNISIYALDPGIFSKSLTTDSAEFFSRDDRGSRTIGEEEKGKQLQNLRTIAEDTNAVLFRGANKFDQMRLIMDADLSSQYQLSYVPKRKKADNLYHKIDVKIGRGDVAVRSRKGYRDYSAEETERIQLVSAYYSPEMFKQLPFEGEFLPFYTDKGKYVPWVSIALPTKRLFLERGAPSTSKRFELNIWLKKGGERAYGGRIDLPFRIDSKFLDYLQRAEYLWFFFTGPELNFDPREYHAVLALVDQETKEIGTWHSLVIPPDLKKSKAPVLMNCVLGSAAENPERKREIFSLNQDNGSLEYGNLKFVPQVTNRFSGRQGTVYAFLQVYDPRGEGKIQPEFAVSRREGPTQAIARELVAESWNKKSKIWSGIFKLDFSPVAVADNTLQVRLPGPEGEGVSSREIRFKKLDY
jgi:VWFA-related protein